MTRVRDEGRQEGDGGVPVLREAESRGPRAPCRSSEVRHLRAAGPAGSTRWWAWGSTPDMTSGPVAAYDSGEAAAARGGASDRSRGVTLVLAFFGGVFGLHRFYTGRVQSGIWMALTFGGLGIWYLYDLILVATGEFRDGAGLRVVRWDVTDVAGYGDPSIRRARELEGDVAALRSEGSELAQRLDFAERLLAQERDRPRLPKT